MVGWIFVQASARVPSDATAAVAAADAMLLAPSHGSRCYRSRRVRSSNVASKSMRDELTAPGRLHIDHDQLCCRPIHQTAV